jgi:AcrR family transcriptional regulator
MPRRDESATRRRELIPVISRAFAELGYRRTTTAELASRCGVRVNILYRLWSDKKAMFLASIDYVYSLSTEVWAALLGGSDGDPRGERSAAERLLAYEARHHGEFGLYRIVFAGLNETDDPDMRKTLREMFHRFHGFIRRQIDVHRAKGSRAEPPDAALSAWGIVGLGTVANIGRELGLITDVQRRRLIGEVGRLMLEGGAS